MSSIKSTDLGKPSIVAGKSPTTTAPLPPDTNNENSSRTDEKKALQQLAAGRKAELALSTLSFFLNRGLQKDGRGDVGMIREGNYSTAPQGAKNGTTQTESLEVAHVGLKRSH